MNDPLAMTPEQQAELIEEHKRYHDALGPDYLEGHTHAVEALYKASDGSVPAQGDRRCGEPHRPRAVLGYIDELLVIATQPHVDQVLDAIDNERFIRCDPYYLRPYDELQAMYAADADHRQALAEHAGVCEEFPGGEFAVPGYNVEYGGY